jgi:N-acetylglucosamine kinase-like BadF-type ATPase
MILIADSGSTKCDWALVEENSSDFSLLSSKGFNPYFHDKEFILNELENHEEFSQIRNEVTKIHFYGAGCSSKNLNARIEEGLQAFFKNSEIFVDHDLKAAAYACYRGKAEIACILGTGSNSCRFDGFNLSESVPSLAYILGDEASGSYFGKRILRSYFYNRMPSELAKELDEQYNVEKEHVIDKVYRQINANVYLAGFMKFFSNHKEHPFVIEMVAKGMREFLKIHVMSYPDAKDLEINFVGSIAHYFSHILIPECDKLGLNVQRIIKKPIEGLVEFHKNYEESNQS